MDEPCELVLPNGRVIEFWDSGSPGAPVLMYHHGTPSCGRPYEHVATAARERGLRLVAFSRAGHALACAAPR